MVVTVDLQWLDLADRDGCGVASRLVGCCCELAELGVGDLAQLVQRNNQRTVVEDGQPGVDLAERDQLGCRR